MNETLIPEDERQEAVAVAFRESGQRHVSSSQIGMYRRCPRQWAYRYILGLKIPPDGGLIVGSGVHHAAEVGMLHKRDTGENPDPDMCRTAAAEYITDELDTGEVRIGEDEPGPDELVDRATRIADVWAVEAAPMVMPVEVEQRFDITLGGIPVTGRLDVITDSGIVDWKTSKRSPQVADLIKSQQTEMYAAASDKGMAYIYLIDTPKMTKVVPVTLSHDDVATARRLAESTVVDVAEGMALGVWPRNRTGWHCSQRWCGYYERCMSGKDDSDLAERASTNRAAVGIAW
jgi:RecB family exonuclease